MDTQLTPLPEPARRNRIARGVLVAVLLLLGLWTIRSFIPSLVWATILALAVWPLYKWAERRFPPGKHNILLPSVFTGGVALLFVVPVLIAAVQIEKEAKGLFDWYQAVQKTGLPPPDWVASVSIGSFRLADWWRDNLTNPPALTDLFKHLDLRAFLDFASKAGTIIAHAIVVFAFTLVTLFFLFRNGASLTRRLIAGSAKIFGPHGERIGRQVVASVHGTVDGLVLVGLGEGLLLGIAYIVTGVPQPTLLGAFTAIAAIIPFGAPVFFMFAALLLAAQGAVGAAVGILVFGTIVITVADHVLRPVLIGGATRLPFLWVLFGILGGVETWGLLGLFLGPALMAALSLLWRELTDENDPIVASEPVVLGKEPKTT
jgi:predicted PurR-regulated permease PerM